MLFSSYIINYLRRKAVVTMADREIKQEFKQLRDMIFQTNRAEVIKLMEEHPEDNIIINSHIKGVTSKCYPWSKIHRR